MAMKWLRKHTKKILVVFVAALMLAFLIQGPLSQRGCGGGARMKDKLVAHAFGQKVMLSEYYAAQFEYLILQGAGLPVPVSDPLDYALLIREARQMGVPTGSEAVPEELAAEVAARNKVADLAGLANKLSQQHGHSVGRITEKLLRQALSNFWAVIRTERLVLDSPRILQQDQGRAVRDFRMTLGPAQPSEKQLELIFRNISEKLDIEYVAFPAWRYGSKVAPASEAEIIKQFEAYKDQYPGTTDNEFGFGYKRRTLIEIEYIKADTNKITAGLEEPSPAVLAEYYEKHKESYALPPEDETDKESEPGTEDKADSEPVKRYAPLEEVYEDLQDRWLQDKARETTLSMIGKARNLARQRWEELRKEQTGTILDPKELYPYAGEQKENVVNQLTEEFKVSPDYQRTGWVDADQAAGLPGIGVSYTSRQPEVGFSFLAFRVEMPVPAQEAEPTQRKILEIGQDCPVTLVDAQGNAYLFRVIGLRKDSILSRQEMLADQKSRDRVAADVSLQQAYEYAKQQAEQLLSLAEQKGLNKTLKEIGNKTLEIRKTDMAARDDPKRAMLRVQLPLVDAQGRTKGEVGLQWQNLGLLRGLSQPVGMLQVNVSNKSQAERITAVGLNLPAELQKVCQEVRHPTGQRGARNGGEPVPAGPAGYTLRYFGRGIEAGKAGKVDLLVGAEGQELVSTPNLAKGGIETGKSETFTFLLLHASQQLTTLDFVSRRNSESAELGGAGFRLVARLETDGGGGKSQLVRGIFPANRQSSFVHECFAVLEKSGLIRRPEPRKKPTQEKEAEQPQAQPTAEKPAEVATRIPDLLTDSRTQQPPCVLVELPREGICYVAEVQKHLPAARAEYRQSRLGVLNALMSEQYTALRRQWWDSNNIRQRTEYQPVEINQDKVSEEQTQAEKSDSTTDG